MKNLNNSFSGWFLIIPLSTFIYGYFSIHFIIESFFYFNNLIDYVILLLFSFCTIISYVVVYSYYKQNLKRVSIFSIILAIISLLLNIFLILNGTLILGLPFLPLTFLLIFTGYKARNYYFTLKEEKISPFKGFLNFILTITIIYSLFIFIVLFGGDIDDISNSIMLIYFVLISTIGWTSILLYHNKKMYSLLFFYSRIGPLLAFIATFFFFYIPSYLNIEEVAFKYGLTHLIILPIFSLSYSCFKQYNKC